MPTVSSVLEVEGRHIGEDHPTYFIADIAANHDGDIERAKDLIFLAAEAGADAAKFQHFQVDSIISKEGFRKLGEKLSHQAKWKESIYDVYKAASVSLDWTQVLKETCKKAGITFFTTPYSLELIESLDEHVPAYKIGSGDISWIDMIEKVASKQKPYFLATGASTADEVDRAVSSALAINPRLALLQCNTNYTGSQDNFKYIQLNVLKTYRAMYPKMILGLSDHTPGHSTVLGSIALGARIIEKHFTDDINRDGPDHTFSMDPRSWLEMVERSRELERALGNGIKKIEKNEMQTVVVQRRALRLTRNMTAGNVIGRKDLEALRPCPADAIQPYQINEIVGRKLDKDKQTGDYLTLRDLL
jgi:sialic acid synthase SpsE